MPKRPGSLELILPSRSPGEAAHRWLYGALRGEILAGRLRTGTRLPSSRDLARQFGLARGTIVGAFEQLAAEGYLEGSVGSGTYVANCLPDDLLEVARRADRPAVGHAAPAPRMSSYGRRVSPFPVLERRPSQAFRPNLPAHDHFPTALWAQLASRRLRRVTADDLFGCDSLGYLPLREAVADYLNTSRGAQCTADQVVIVSGVHESLDLAARLLVDPGDRAVVENPGYAAAAAILEAVGAEIVAVDVDEDGLDTRAEALGDARLVYVTPAHQYPLGVTLSAARRLALVDWARATDGWIFEDDYDSEFRYSGHPVPALQGLCGGDRVLFAGSFNKVLFSSLRLGYLVVPPDLLERALALRSLTRRHPPLLEQTVLLDFLAQGHFGRHLRRMRQIYGERRAALVECAREYLDGAVELSPVEAGLQTSGRLAGGVGAEAVADAAATREVEVVPLRRFARRPLTFEGLQLGFAAVEREEIRRGARELAAAIDQVRGAL